jgi:acid stress-induced BolA-like protein IbaG/YrbA
MDYIKELISLIKEKLPSSEVYINANDGVHLEAIVISSVFEGISLVKQHQMVMLSLKEHFNSQELHALALKTYTPESWENSKHSLKLSEAIHG